MPSDRFNLDDYVSVAERLLKFRAEHDGWSLVSEMLVDDGKRIVMRASVIDSAGVLRAVGHAEEVRDQGPVNRTSAVENAETSAWGRALACLGLHVSRQIASRDEIEQARERAQRAAEPPDPAKVRRSKIRDRAKALPEHAQSAFRSWLDETRTPRVFAEMTDAQADAAEEWLTNAESEVEHDAQTRSEAPRSDSGAPNEAGGTDAAANPDSGPVGVKGGREAAAASYVAGLDGAQLLAEFGRLNARAPRQVREQRQVLTALLAEDPAWAPA